MEHDPGYARFFAYLNLFCGAMLILVLGRHLPVMFVGWEGVGLCSYLLIGFWYENDANADAGTKAFIVNRIGDFGFLLGMFLLFSVTEDAQLRGAHGAGESGAALRAAALLGLPSGALLRPASCCSSARTGKSAQIPLYVWLPDAMAGPTPVSALIHAATMVTAGVYMVVPPARSSIVLSPARAGRRRRRSARSPRSFAAIIGVRAERLQEGAGLLDGQPARLHVRRGVGTGNFDRPAIFHLVHPRLLQGLPVPRRRLGHARA